MQNDPFPARAGKGFFVVQPETVLTIAMKNRSAAT